MSLSRDGTLRRGIEPTPSEPLLPLCVDLDGTLVHTDTLHEALALGARNPLRLAKALMLLRRGKAPFKEAVYREAALDAASLPFNADLLEYLREQRRRGRALHLVTAADRQVAEGVAEALGLFDSVIASDGERNLRGANKVKILEERFGAGGFAYAGNDATDLKVWAGAGAIVLVNCPGSVAKRARGLGDVEAEFKGSRLDVRGLLKALRPHQWAKNALVFVPILASTRIFDFGAWGRCLLLFAAMSCVASCIYILNDLTDLNADRLHPRKRLRPFASGRVSVRTGLATSLVLGLVGLGISLPAGGLLPLLAYAAISTSYSFFLKEKALVDVFLLAALYTIRIVAGGLVSGYEVTEWLLGFSVFAFLSLAIAKRVAELVGTQARAGGQLARRAYTDQDVPLLQMTGISSGFIAAVVLALYLQSQAARALYAHPKLLMFVVVAALFWFCRVWLETSRGRMHDDPVVWAIKDRPSQLLALVTAAALAAAMGHL
jgi:4-hydroxybenzoate polyprenyltransferase